MEQKIIVRGVEIYAPRQLVLDALQYVSKGKVLDLGCGYGRHAIYLAVEGFEVTAVENDSVKIESLNRKAAQAELSIRTLLMDLKDFDAEGEIYDLILSTMTLHFLNNHGEVTTAVKHMQDMTAPGGINVLCAYTDKSQSDLRPYLVNAEDLKHIYAGWKLLHFKEYEGTDAQVDGPTKGKEIVRVEIIARKKK